MTPTAGVFCSAGKPRPGKRLDDELPPAAAPERRAIAIGSAAAARDLLEDGGIVCLPTEASWLLACLVGSQHSVAALQSAGGPAAVAFSSWAEARLFVEATAVAHALAGHFLPGPLGIVCDCAQEADHADLAGLARPGGALEVHVPSHTVVHELLGELGPMAVVRLPVAGDAETVRQHLTGLALRECAIVLGVAGPGRLTTVDARGTRVDVVREGVIPKQEVEDACR